MAATLATPHRGQVIRPSSTMSPRSFVQAESNGPDPRSDVFGPLPLEPEDHVPDPSRGREEPGAFHEFRVGLPAVV